jgi:hypothetical protein
MGTITRGYANLITADGPNAVASGSIQAADLASGVGGKVLQVVQGTKTDTTSVTATTYTSLGLSVSITPSSSSSNILVLVNAKVGWVTGQLRYTALFRNATQILMPTSYSSRQQASLVWTDTSNSQGIYPAIDMFLDSPATTSATTYGLYAKVYSSGTIYINRSSSDGDGGNDARTASSIIAMEIGA